MLLPRASAAATAAMPCHGSHDAPAADHPASPETPRGTSAPAPAPMHAACPLCVPAAPRVVVEAAPALPTAPGFVAAVAVLHDGPRREPPVPPPKARA